METEAKKNVYNPALQKPISRADYFLCRRASNK